MATTMATPVHRIWRNAVSSSIGGAWSVMGEAGNALAGAWSVRNAAGSELSGAWTVEGGGPPVITASSELPGAWTVRVSVYAALSGSWRVLGDYAPEAETMYVSIADAKTYTSQAVSAAYLSIARQ